MPASAHVHIVNGLPAFGSHNVTRTQESRFQLNLGEVDEMAVLAVDEWIQIDDKKDDKAPKEETKVEGISGGSDLIKKLLNKAAPIKAEAEDEKEFFKREMSIKPPLPGKITNVPFPGKQEERKQLSFDPKDINVEEVAENLNVTRYFPEGEVGYSCSRLKIAFDQPMVSVGTVTDVAAQFAKMGINISPEAKGNWQWSGTKLCQFMAQHRFRYSTEYKVTIPKGLKSALGGVLEEEKSFVFKTPTLSFSSFSSFPHMDLSPVLCCTFNQDVRKEELCKALKVVGTSATPIFLTPDAKGNLDDNDAGPLTDEQKRHVKRWWKAQGEMRQPRSICLRFSEPLQKDTKHKVKIPAGSVLGEGERPCGSAVERNFETYPPNCISRHHPARSSRSSCNPGTTLTICFKNAINRRAVRKEDFKISPPVSGMKIRVNGTNVAIDHDDLEIGTEYKVTVNPEIIDRWGQTLSGDNTVTFKKVTQREDRKWGDLGGESGVRITLDPFCEKPEYLVRVTNYEELQVTAYRVSPADFMNRDLFNSWKIARQGKGEWPLPVIKKETLAVEATTRAECRGKPQPFRIPVHRYLEQKDHNGHVLLVVEPTKKAFLNNSSPPSGVVSAVADMFRNRYKKERPLCVVWLERTQLGLDLISSGREEDKKYIAWVTDLRTGKPVKGAKIKPLPARGETAKALGTRELTTDANGLVTVPPSITNFKGLVTATLGDDTTFLNEDFSFHSHARKIWNVFNDRGMYKPNEEVSIKGYARELQTQGDALVPKFPKIAGNGTAPELDISVYDPRGMQIESLTQKAKLNAYGAFHFTLKLPDNINTGRVMVRLNIAKWGSSSHSFTVEEFRRPEYDVSARHRPGGKNYHYANPLEADWTQLKSSQDETTEKAISNCLETLSVVAERERQQRAGALEEQLFSARRKGDKALLESATAKIAKHKAEAAKELKAEEKAEEKRLRTRVQLMRTNPDFKFQKAQSEPCVIASVSANYFAGGGLSDAQVNWRVTATTASYTPPNCIGYTFGKQSKWWWQDIYVGGGGDNFNCVGNFSGKTDAKGAHEVSIRWSGLRDDSCSPLNVTADANVMDINNQMRSASTSFLIHPCRYYVGFKLEKPTGEAGKAIKVGVIVVDPSGKQVEGVKAEVTLSGHRDVRMEDDQGLMVSKTLHAFDATSVVSKAGEGGGEEKENKAEKKQTVIATLVPPMGGSYNLTVRVYDEFGGWHESKSATLYVSDPAQPDGGSVSYDQLRMWRVPQEALTLIPDKKEYEIEETASIMIRSPFSPAEGILYIKCDGMAASVKEEGGGGEAKESSSSVIPFSIEKGKDSVEVRLKIRKEWLPIATLKAIISGAHKREASFNPSLPGDGKDCDDDDAKGNAQLRPAYASGQISVEISRNCYKLDVDVVPAKHTDEIAPGKTIHSTVTVKDYAGNPVPNAEVCLVMVDEAVLSLSGHTITSMLRPMYAYRTSHSSTLKRSREGLYLLPLPEAKAVQEPPEEMAVDAFGNVEMAMAPMKMMSRAMPMRCAAAAPRRRSRGRAQKMKKRKKNNAKKEAERMSIESDSDSDGGEDDFGLDDDGKIAVRKNFNPLAAFLPSVMTDEKGMAADLEVSLPDNLTSYRVWAVVATESQYGLAEASIAVSLPLMCSVSVVLQNQTPRDLVALIAARGTNVNVDQAKCAAKVTLKALQRGVVHFGVKAAKAGVARLQFVSSAKGAADAAEVSLPVFTPATSEAFATYGSIDIDGQDSDMTPKKAGEDGEPVDLRMEEEEEDEEEEEGDAKLKDQLVVQPIKAPKNVWGQFGGVEVSTSSPCLHTFTASQNAYKLLSIDDSPPIVYQTTQLQHLTDAVVSLYSYEYECSEQLASRILGILSVNDVLKAFQSSQLPDEAALASKLKSWLKTLYSRQASNGGFWTWGPPKWYNLLTKPSPFMSVHVACCLALCEEKKIEVKESAKRAALSYLHNIEARLAEFPFIKYWGPRWYSSVVVFALYARTQWKENVAAEAAKFYRKRGGGDFDSETLARLLVVLSKDQLEHGPLIAQLKKDLQKHVTEEADTAYFITSYDEVCSHMMLSSNRRTDAAVLEALVAVDGTKNTLSPKICKGLLKHKLKSGGWGSTQENCWVLLGLVRYFHEFEKHEPDFEITLWYGALFGGKQVWKGRSTETKQVLIPMNGVLALGDNNFMIHKEGKGRLYYRIGMSYAPKSLRVDAANYGFKVSRTYAPAGDDDKDNVVFDQAAGSWRAKLGERVKVTITMVTTAKRYHVALVDYLPAGLEPLNPALKGSPKGDDDDAQTRGRGGGRFGAPRRRMRNYNNPYTYRCYSRRYWPEHINLRNERAEAFRSLLWPGVYEFTFTTRATTAGTFVVPPAKAEEMYSPENFGRSESLMFEVVANE
eukprot:jgi/Bigna1/75662/fgenesh1_pg.36_\